MTTWSITTVFPIKAINTLFSRFDCVHRFSGIVTFVFGPALRSPQVNVISSLLGGTSLWDKGVPGCKSNVSTFPHFPLIHTRAEHLDPSQHFTSAFFSTFHSVDFSGIYRNLTDMHGFSAHERHLQELSVQTEALCIGKFSWAMNSFGQSPCLVAAYLLAPCVAGGASILRVLVRALKCLALLRLACP